MSKLQSILQPKAEANPGDQSPKANNYECKTLAEGTVTQTLQVKAMISRGANQFRPTDQWRGIIHIGDLAEWEWCKSESDAVAFVNRMLPKSFIPNTNSTAA